jgi:hypothetical protein
MAWLRTTLSYNHNLRLAEGYQRDEEYLRSTRRCYETIQRICDFISCYCFSCFSRNDSEIPEQVLDGHRLHITIETPLLPPSASLNNLTMGFS